MLEEILSYRPTHVFHKLKSTNIPLISYHTIAKNQNYNVPVLFSDSLDTMKGFLVASQSLKAVNGISVPISNEDNIDRANRIFEELACYLHTMGYITPFFLEASITLSKYEDSLDNMFYYAVQSYFTSFMIGVTHTDLDKQIDSLNQIVKPIKERELGFTLYLKNSPYFTDEMRKELRKSLHLLGIQANAWVYQDGERVETCNSGYFLNQEFELQNKSLIYIPDAMLDGKLSIESESFYKSRDILKRINCTKTVGKLSDAMLHEDE
ncbi:hypothetical protein JXR93_12905 [bacterium]|nr:hypothetical protein [bacterium]